VKLVAAARSLILFNSASLWHSGTLNYSLGLRLAVTACLAPRGAEPGAAELSAIGVAKPTGGRRTRGVTAALRWMGRGARPGFCGSFRAALPGPRPSQPVTAGTARTGLC
jgi:hypothetical protein